MVSKDFGMPNHPADAVALFSEYSDGFAAANFIQTHPDGFDFVITEGHKRSPVYNVTLAPSAEEYKPVPPRTKAQFGHRPLDLGVGWRKIRRQNEEPVPVKSEFLIASTSAKQIRSH